MDELLLVRGFRAEAPTITDAAHDRIRERVLKIVDAEPIPKTRPRQRRLGLWQPPMMRRGGSRILVVTSAVAALLVVPVLAFGGRVIDLLWPTTPVASSSFTGVSQSMLKRISGSSSGATVQQIASNGSLTYYLVAGQNGQTCLASGTTGTPNVLGAVGPCSDDPSSLLPSTGQPVILNTTVELDPKTGTIIGVPDVSGLVVDAINEVELTDASGSILASTAVTDHVFELDHLEGLPISTLVALDSSGHRLYEKALPVSSQKP